MRSLILGAGGFVGRYLAQELQTAGYDVTATKLSHEQLCLPGCEIVDLDITHAEETRDFFETHRPDVIFHLAAQSSVARAWANPEQTVEINIAGCLHVLDAIHAIPAYQPRILLIGSGEEYGSVPAGCTSLSEDQVCHPGNPYAVTKLCQNQFGTIYAKAYDMDILLIRAFNHMGPGQSPQFVVADFSKQAAAIALGQAEPVLYTGNLSVARDFTDVRDVVRAYRLLAEHGKAGETYNVGSGRAVPLQRILDMILAQTGMDVDVRTDPKKFRPAEVPVLAADITKLCACTAWQPEIALSVTIADTYAYWLDALKREGGES